MKMKALFLTLSLFAGLAAFAQDAQPQPAQQQVVSAEPNEGAHFDISTSYAKLTDGADATVISARLPVSERFAVVYSQYQIPSLNAQFFLGQAEFRERASHIFKSKGSAQTNLDAIQLFVRGGAGSRRDSLGNPANFAYGVSGGAEIGIGQLATAATSLHFEVGFLGSRGKFIVLQSSPTVGAGLSLRF
jgi:hypothetical protein